MYNSNTQHSYDLCVLTILPAVYNISCARKKSSRDCSCAERRRRGGSRQLSTTAATGARRNLDMFLFFSVVGRYL